MTTDAEKIEYYRKALERLASNESFNSAATIAEEDIRRRQYAEDALKGPQPDPVSAFKLWREQHVIIEPGENALTRAGWNAAIDAAKRAILNKRPQDCQAAIEALRED